MIGLPSVGTRGSKAARCTERQRRGALLYRRRVQPELGRSRQLARQALTKRPGTVDTPLAFLPRESGHEHDPLVPATPARSVGGRRATANCVANTVRDDEPTLAKADMEERRF